MQKEILATIELGGVLGKTFGKTHQRLISTTGESIRALCCTLDGFEQYLNSSKSRGLTYAVFRGKKNIGVDDMGFPVTNEVIRIVPVVIGSKKAGMLQTIFGAVLVVVGAVVGFYTSWTGVGGAIGSGMVKMGTAMMLGGVIQMLSPQPGGLAMKDQGENKPSYAFGSPTNTVSQGYPVPIGYGKRRIGGAIISAGVYVEDQQ
ncbi:tail assembly protein [Xenorhabdus griffiniae]|uniref:Tail assembly protein n=1 Tax=Xenorhabdus griffiniae TaxID=351672 RepID=A0ABY9XDF5_9GAMM|nr:tail assembly protein [Xenorhabdus griffiniae]MBD1229267.1 tail assembly protein [Xenorhabdus griffiniae]MBE8588900.1 tail assembly protein [Xenorhabdus griffiniae]WMV70951.1 tail assembly protein [Xenorhabdus griffiniae]WNH00627.1 tail assembly protein [Xenorhabdus griffiniae]